VALLAGTSQAGQRTGQASRVYVVEPRGEISPDPQGPQVGLFMLLETALRGEPGSEAEQARLSGALGCFRCEAAMLVRVLEKQRTPA
jgi:hypothetical protein